MWLIFIKSFINDYFNVKWNLNDESTHFKLDILENFATAFVFVIVVVNVFITAFGVQRPNSGASAPS
ncbi:Ninjurin-1 [Ameca splendens]|uniref:Ninjurin-1 n=1 Tax=Ameca splendens TaxID=208324 RepID=A0ABV0YER7_9TELE